MADKIHCVRKTLRLRPTEADLLAERADKANMSEAEYLRLLINQRPNCYPAIRKLLKDLINEMNRIGNNINQITHRNNMGFYSADDKNQLVAYMKKLNISIEEAVKTFGDNENSTYEKR